MRLRTRVFQGIASLVVFFLLFFGYSSVGFAQSISNVSPNSGESSGGQYVTLTGTGLSESLELDRIALGTQHSCALTPTGQAYCWGYNFAGALGTANTADYSVPTAVNTSGALLGKTLTTIIPGSAHTCALDTDGEAYCWGYNIDGQLGNNSNTNSSMPEHVLGGLTFTQLAAGDDHTCGLTNTNTIYCWGGNTHGQLGTGNNNPSWLPVPVATISGETVISIVAGRNHTCAQTLSGKAYCWGSNTNRQLGDGTTNPSALSPSLVVDTGALNGLSIVSLSAKGDISCALANNNRIYCWGDGNNGQLGNNGWATSNVPVAVDNTGALLGQTIDQVQVGHSHVCALSTTGAAFCWGYNGMGQLGNGAAGTDSGVPVAVTMNGQTFTELSLGHQHACAITTNNASYCWGGNYYGNLGNGVSGAGQYNAQPTASTLPSSPIPYSVVIGGTNATVDTRSATTINFLTPAHPAGLVDIVLSAMGFPTITLTNAYTYIDTTSPSYEVYRFGPTPMTTPVSSYSLVYRIVFNEPVTGLDSLSDLVLTPTGSATGTISEIVPINTSQYYVIVTNVSGTGDISLQLAPSHDVVDLSANPATTAPSLSLSFAIAPANTGMPTVHPMFTINQTPTIRGTWKEGDHTNLSVQVNGTTYTLASPQLTSDGNGNWALNLTGTTPLDAGTYSVRATSVGEFPTSNASSDELVILPSTKVTGSTEVYAQVSEALILLLDTTAIMLNADPLTNDGRNNSQSSLLTVFSNALNGYSISGALRDSQGDAALSNTALSASIRSDRTDGDNYFSYFARNTSTITPSTAERDFSSTASQLLDEHGNPIGYHTTTDGQAHRIGYDLNINFMTPAGIYTGTVFYTVTANF